MGCSTALHHQPCRCLENPFSIPGQKLGRGKLADMLRRMDRPPMELQFTFHAPASADRMLAEDHSVRSRFDREGAQVQQLVVQRAQSQAVLLDVRSADVVPLDVGSLQPCGREPDAHVEPADAAPVLVGPQHTAAKARITKLATTYPKSDLPRVLLCHAMLSDAKPSNDQPIVRGVEWSVFMRGLECCCELFPNRLVAF